MNTRHFLTFVWLQWRLRLNQLSRGGVGNLIVLILILIGAVLTAGFMFIGMLLLGAFGLKDAAPAVIMYVWDGLILSFLFCWMIGLLMELQRAEGLALSKFLHLPVALTTVFLLNYLVSLVCFTSIVFVPAMMGLTIGLAMSRGPSMLLLLPLTAAFLLIVTAVSYQFQGWLASLMQNKRRRRTVIVIVTTLFVLLAQLPNLINIARPWGAGEERRNKEFAKEHEEATRALNAKEIDLEEFKRRNTEITKRQLAETKERDERFMTGLEQSARIGNLVLPPGWLALGAEAVAEENLAMAGLCFLGMAFLGSLSLWRAYRTTLRIYTGVYTSGAAMPSAVAASIPAAPKVPTGPSEPARLLERQLPWISEQAAAIAMASLRSLTRAPEAKMTLLTPILMVFVFGFLFFRMETEPPKGLRPLMPLGGMLMVLFTLVQLVGNQFGFDRSGFRVYVLCPADRGDVLLGKNLAVAPLALTLGLVLCAVIQVVYPMRIDHLLATLPNFVTMYLIFALIANCLSIMAPLPVAAGSMRASNSRLVPILLHMAFTLTLPVALAPVMLPLGVEAILEEMLSLPTLPVALVSSLIECGGAMLLYRWLVRQQGQWLYAREQKILAIVAAKAE